MNRDDDEDALAGVDLHKWHVPPPPAGQRNAILARALAPAPPPSRRRRVVAGVIGLVIANAAIAVMVATLLIRATPRPVPAPTQVLPAGPLDDVRKLRRELDELTTERARVLREVERLTAEMREAERELAELRARLDGKTPRPRPQYGKPPSTGRLTMSTKPPARVRLDGVDVGYTPLRDIELAAGRHQVTFETMDGARHHYSITIEAGKTLKLVKDFSPREDK